MKSKFILIVIVLAIGAFLFNSHLEHKAKRDAQKAETSRIQLEVKTAVSQISERHNAITDWEEQLSKGENYRLSPILTIELENLWKGKRPILFIGSIKDISSAGADEYYVLLERSLYSIKYMFNTELRLLLTAPKAVIDPFLHKHPELLSADNFDNGAAIIAQIYSINTSDEHYEDGELIEVKTGRGRLIEIVYTGDAFF